MFNFTSRYINLETGTYTTKEGGKIAYVRRRFLPQGQEMQLLAEVLVAEGDRLDIVTARTLGDPEQYWRIADANNTLNPSELTDEVGRRIRIPVPQG